MRDLLTCSPESYDMIFNRVPTGPARGGSRMIFLDAHYSPVDCPSRLCIESCVKSRGYYMQPIHNLRIRSVSLILNPAMQSVDTILYRFLVGTTPCGETDITMLSSHLDSVVEIPGSDVTCGISLLHVAKLHFLGVPLTGSPQVCVEGLWNKISHVPSDGKQHCSSAQEERDYECLRILEQSLL